ncbi:MAG: hypothetical protein ACLR23_07585 [Clostridia bacterium]
MLIVAAVEPSIDVLATALAMLSLKVATYAHIALLVKRTPRGSGSVEFAQWVDEEDEELPVEQWDRWQTYMNLKARKREKKLQRSWTETPLPVSRASAQDQRQDEGHFNFLF